MQARERYLRTLRGEPVDFVPRVPILMQFAAEFIGSDYGAFASDHRVLVEANLRCAEAFGFDQLSAISDPYRETQGFGGRVTYRTDGPPRCTAPLAETRELDSLPRLDPYAAERMRDRIEGVRALAEAAPGHSILGWVEGPAAEAADLRGVVRFLYDLMDDPGFTGALMDRCVDTAIDFAAAQVEAGADTVGIGDAIASQLSPRVYTALVLPRERRLVEAIHGLGALVKLHICGNITHPLPGIATLGVDVLDVDHMVDLRQVRAAVGPGVALTGNLDPVGRVLHGTPDAIRAAVRACYEAAGNPYLVNAGCEIPSGTPVENLMALCEPVAYRGG